jgi:hypothetical protein
MSSVSQYGTNQLTLAATLDASARRTNELDRSARRVDIALLVSALFLQRFSLTFGKIFLELDLVPVAFILLYQFAFGKVIIQYDRLLWFLAVGLAATCSLLLGSAGAAGMSSYLLFIVCCSLLIFTRPTAPAQYKNTLHAFQFLVVLLSCIGVAQFFAQFVLDGRKLIMFYGIIPDFLFEYQYAGGENTVHALSEGSHILKSNGLFLGEPSNFSQITAIGILIEVLEFRRPRYLLVMALGFLVAYSGTGIMTLLLFLPLAGLRHGKAGLSAAVVAIFALGLFATGIFDLSAFSGRVGEFQDPRSSGYGRFVAPFLLTARQFDTGSLFSLLVGNGPGSAKNLNTTISYIASTPTWCKLFIEYGMLGSFIFPCFLASCLRRSRCPGLILAALVSSYVVHGGLVDPKWLVILVVLCTLSGSKARQHPMDDTREYRPFVASPSQNTHVGIPAHFP